jgi:hypothetical protein
MTQPMTQHTDPGPDDSLVRCRVTGADPDALRRFLADSGADTSCRPVAVRTDAGLVTQVLLTRTQLTSARRARTAAAVEIEEVEDVTASQRAARADVSRRPRYAQRGEVPRGLGRKE